MKCVTYKNVIRTGPGGAYAHMRTHDGEIEVPTLVPSHRRVKKGLTTIKIARLSQKAGGCHVQVGAYTERRCRKAGKGMQNGMDKNGGGGKSMRTNV